MIVVFDFFVLLELLSLLIKFDKTEETNKRDVINLGILNFSYSLAFTEIST